MKELGERYTADSAPQSNRIDNVLFKVPARLSDSLDWPLGPSNKEWHVQHIICQNWFAKSHKTIEIPTIGRAAICVFSPWRQMLLRLPFAPPKVEYKVLLPFQCPTTTPHRPSTQCHIRPNCGLLSIRQCTTHFASNPKRYFLAQSIEARSKSTR